jgi:hypothetical protein
MEWAKTTTTNCTLQVHLHFPYIKKIVLYLVAGRSRESSPGSEGGLDGVSKKEALSIIRYLNFKLYSLSFNLGPNNYKDTKP